MVLQALNALYDRLAKDTSYQVPSPGYSRQKITFKVVLAPDGRLVAIQDARVSTEGKLRPDAVRVLGETKSPGSAINPCFLWDNSAYMLGYRSDDAAPERTAKAFAAFCKLHLERQSEIGCPAYDTVCGFLRAWDPNEADKFDALREAGSTGFGVFQIQGEAAWVHEDPTIDAWWRQQSSDKDAEEVGVCLVTGQNGPLARLHEKIKGVVGGQGGGAPLVGFNASAFESFGKEQSFNAPVARDVAFRYGAALNALLDGPMSRKHTLRLGDTTVAFWTERPSFVEDIFTRFALDGASALDKVDAQDQGLLQRLHSFLSALRQGREKPTGLDAETLRTGYFVLGLAPNAGRMAVRFFHTGSIAELLDHLRRHHEDIRQEPAPAVGRRRADPEFPPAWLLLQQTARESKDVPPLLAGPLLRSIVAGTDYPQALYAAVLRRIAADREVNYARACVLKGYLNRNLHREVTMSLDRERQEPAYRLGRLFAALEKTQRDALGSGLNATIRDRFYGAASATPANVFPRLLRTYQHHLAKLTGGHRINRERLVQEIVDPIRAFPSHFALADQGLFAIGYYHQNRDFYARHEQNQTVATEASEGE